MSKLFSFNFNINLIYIIIYWILEIFIRITMSYEPEYYTISNNPKDNEFMFIIFPVISKLFSGFIILYVYCVFRKNSSSAIINKNELIYENPIDNKINKYFFLKILFITCLELLSNCSYFIFFLIIDAEKEEVSHKSTKDVITLLDILVRYIFSICILKVRVFKHHMWSIYAMIFGFLLIVPFDICDIYYEEKMHKVYSTSYVIVIFFLLAFKSVIYPLEDTYIKKFFNTYYILPENLLFYISICETIILTIFGLIFYISNTLKFDLILSPAVIITSIIYILTTAVREYILIKIIYLFSSQSVSFLIISQNISVSLIDIINFIKEKDKSNIQPHVYISFPFEIIALFIIIIATSVYDEIIIINRCGLNLNVKRGIIERAQLDIESTSVDESFDEYYESKEIN